MSLRRFLIASSLILAPLTILSFGSAAFAESDTVNIEISGNVPLTLDLAASATTAATDLPLSVIGQRTVNIADLTVTTNASSLIITASSTNSGNLMNTNDPFAFVPYTLDIVGSGGQSLNPRTVANLKQTVGSEQLDLFIGFNISGPLAAGNYNDTITLIVADN
jgi:hypothetical protein